MFGNNEGENTPLFNNRDSATSSTTTSSNPFVTSSSASTSNPFTSTLETKTEKKPENSFGMGPPSYFSSYSMMGSHSSMFPLNPMAEYIRKRNAEKAAKEAALKAPWKFDPPTFQFGEPYKQPHEKQKEKEEQEKNENGKRPKEDEEEEWIQSPFCGQRYRKKDVDALVAFADKYIKSECENSKWRKWDEKEAEEKTIGVDEKRKEGKHGADEVKEGQGADETTEKSEALEKKEESDDSKAAAAAELP
jgi:hypothetical protein